MEEFLIFKVLWPWPWIGWHGIPLCITHQPLPKYQISLRWEVKKCQRSRSIFVPSSKSRDKELGRISKMWPVKLLILSCSVIIYHQSLDWAIERILAKEIYFEFGWFCNFSVPVTLTLYPGQGHTVVHLSSSRAYYLYTMFDEHRINLRK